MAQDPATEKRPEPADIEARATKYFSLHEARISELGDMMNLVNRDYEPFQGIAIPDKYATVVPGTAGALVHRAATQVTADIPVVTYEPRNSSQKAQEQADLAERFGHAILTGAAADSPVAPLEDAAKRALLGMWVLKGPCFDFDAWGEPPTRRGKTKREFEHATQQYRIRQAESFAFKWESEDPAQIVWDPMNPSNPQWTIKRHYVPVWSLQSKYPFWPNPENRQEDENALVYEYVSDTWRIVVADGKAITRFKEDPKGKYEEGGVRNIYGFQTRQIGFGVWGFQGTDPQLAARSLLFFIEDEIREEARAASLLGWALQTYGVPVMAAKDPESFREAMKLFAPVLQIEGEGKMDDHMPRPVQLPSPPPWVERYMAQIQERKGANSVTESLMGYREPGMTSGVMSGLHIGEGRMLFNPITKRLSQHASRYVNRCAWIVEKMIQEPVSVWLDRGGTRQLLTVEPGTWSGSYHTHVDLEPIDPTRDDRRAMLGLNLFAQGLIDPWTCIEEYLRIPNASAVIKNLIKWKVMNSPEFLQAVSTEVAQDLGMTPQDVNAAGDGGMGEPTNAEAGQAPGGQNAGAVGDFAAFTGGNKLNVDQPNKQRELNAPARGASKIGSRAVA